MNSMKTFGIFGKTAASGCGCALGQTDEEKMTLETANKLLAALEACAKEYAAKNGVSEDVAQQRMMDPAYEAEFKPCVEAQAAPPVIASPADTKTISAKPIVLARPSAMSKLRADATPRNLAILGGVAAAIFLLTPGSKTRSARTVPNRRRRARRNGSWMPTDYKVGGQYGAPMGRGRGSEKLTGKVHLRRVPLDRGGYDRGGAYWGTGAPLWVAWDDDGNEEYVRAPSREAAKAKLPAYKFYKN